MVVPGMLNMAEVMAESGYTEEDVFDCGICGQIVFLVVVPLVGACRVPVEALSHFMAGADDYAAERMPEHWSGALSGKWTIKRDRLRILEKSWTAFSDECDKLAEASHQAEYTTAWENLDHIDDLDKEIRTWETTSATDIQQLDRKEQRVAALREKRDALYRSVFPGDSQQQAIGASGGVWAMVRPERFPGYRKPLYDLLKTANIAGEPRPTARDVLDRWKHKPPPDVPEVMSDGLKYFDANGDTKTADLKAIQQAIKNLTIKHAG
jgi:hypothetical protein